MICCHPLHSRTTAHCLHVPCLLGLQACVALCTAVHDLCSSVQVDFGLREQAPWERGGGPGQPIPLLALPLRDLDLHALREGQVSPAAQSAIQHKPYTAPAPRKHMVYNGGAIVAIKAEHDHRHIPDVMSMHNLTKQRAAQFCLPETWQSHAERAMGRRLS